MEIRAVGGTVKLDFTDAVITGPTLQIQAEVRGGWLVAGDQAGASRLMPMPWRCMAETVKVRARTRLATSPVSLTDRRISGQTRGGHVVARPAAPGRFRRGGCCAAQRTVPQVG